MNLSQHLLRFFKACPVENALERVRKNIAAMPVRREPMSGQMLSYIQRDEVLGWIENEITTQKT